jgi:precorrin-6B methylase 2
MISILIVGVFAAIAAVWVLVPAWYGLPPIASRPERIHRALQMANLKPGEIFYDLGSGHGSVLIVAAREYGASAIGVEGGPVQCLIAAINARWNRVNSQVRIEAGDMYQADLRDADVVYAYLTSQYAPRLEQLFGQLKSGARVVTVSFDLPNWSPVEVDRENLIFLYIK